MTIVRFALSRMKGEVSAEDASRVNAQASAVDAHADGAAMAASSVVENQGAAVAEESIGSISGGASEGADKAEGLLGGIADTISSLWS